MTAKKTMTREEEHEFYSRAETRGLRDRLGVVGVG